MRIRASIYTCKHNQKEEAVQTTPKGMDLLVILEDILIVYCLTIMDAYCLDI